MSKAFFSSILWLTEQHISEDKNHEKRFFGPNRTNSSNFIYKQSLGDTLFIPLPYLAMRKAKDNMCSEADQDKTIYRVIFVIPEIVEETDCQRLCALLPNTRVELWDSPKLDALFSRYLTPNKDFVAIGLSDFKEIQVQIDFFSILNNDPRPPETALGKQLLNLQSRFNHKLCFKILKTTKNEYKEGDLFCENKYAEVEAIVLCADIVSFTAIINQQKEPSFIGRLMKKWYKEVYRLVMAHNGFLDKFMGDGFLALFDYPFADNQKQGMINAFQCASALIECTQRLIYSEVVEKNFPALHYKSANIGTLRCGICRGKVYTAPTATLADEIYQDFFIVSNAVVTATRIQSATAAQTIGVACDDFHVLTDAMRHNNCQHITATIKNKEFDFFQCLPIKEHTE